MPLILQNEQLVLNAYAVLIGETPGNRSFEYHLNFVQNYGGADGSGYTAALDSIFAGYTNAQLAAMMLTNLGLNGLWAAADAELYLSYNPQNRVGAMIAVADMLYDYNGDNAALLTAKANYVESIDWSYNYSVDSDNAAGIDLPNSGGQTYLLDTTIQLMTGTAFADSYVANLADGQNTLQSGDHINGGAGLDTLFATLGNSSSFAILAQTTSVETVSIRVQSTNGDGSSGENNVDASTDEQVTIDAQDMDGVTTWTNVDSRADLVIEDIRIEDQQITKDITIRWSNADPGSTATDPNNNPNETENGEVDFEVYFSPESLRKQAPLTDTELVLAVGNQLEVSKGFDSAKPLEDIPFSAVGFNVDGVFQAFKFVNGGTIETYDEFWTTLKAGFDAAKADGSIDSRLELVRVINGDDFVARDGETRSSDTYNLTISGGTLTVGAQGWFNPDTVTPPNVAFSAIIEPGNTSVDNPLITSTIILDNIGRESEAGDLVIGSMSTRTGVEKFDITVENNSNTSGAYTASGSWLSNMRSTNNVLEEVWAENATDGIASPDYLYVGTHDVSEADGNDLTDARGNPIFLDTDGLKDVRVFNAASMQGDVRVGAAITEESIAKYQDLVDSAVAHGEDDVEFQYHTGTGDDSFNLVIDAEVAASASHIVVGRHDFSFNIATGAGDDYIKVELAPKLLGGNQAWYINQTINDNVEIHGGDGADTIFTPGAGDVNIFGDAGNDTIYADNTGDDGTDFADGKAAWVFNSVDVDTEDLESQAAAVAATGVNLQLTVTYQREDGIYSKTVNVANSQGALKDVSITDLHINQAIKDAINNDAVLQKLLVAEDNAGRTLTVSSLIDGTHVAGDLEISLSTTALTAAQTTAGVALITDAEALVLGFDAFAAGVSTATAGPGARYDSELAQEAAADIVGVESSTVSDNVIEAGTGDDVIVLGTTIGASALESSNDTLVWTSYNNGFDTVVNFVDDTLIAGGDLLDFTAYGDVSGLATGAGAVFSGTAADDVDNVSVFDFLADATETFANLTAANLKAALNGTAAATDYGNNLTNALDDDTAAGLASSIEDYVVMIRSDVVGQEGVYKVFHLVSNEATNDYTDVQLIGTVDFGYELTGLAAANVL